MYCKFCEKDAEGEPLCLTCSKATVDKLGWWLRYSPALVWPLATWLIGYGAYRLVIALKPAFAPRIMHGLVVMVLIIFVKGIWATYCRHSFHARVQAGSMPTVLGGVTLQVGSGIPGTVNSQEVVLDSVEQTLER